jgi:hypothetical protein
LNKPKNENSILVFATLGVYLGLVLVGATPRVSAQQGQSNEINKRPLIDFAAYAKDRVESKDIDLTGAFSVTVEGPLSPKGMLDMSATTVHSTGDPKLADIAKSGITALNDAGYFQYFSALGAENLSIIVTQDDKRFSGQFQLKMKTPERAKTLASALNTMIQVSKNSERDHDDKLLIENASATVDGNHVKVSTVVQAVPFRQMFLSRLSEFKGE